MKKKSEGNDSNNTEQSNNNAKPGEKSYTLTAAEKEIVNKIVLTLTPIYNNTSYTALSEKEKAKLIKNLTEQSYTLPKGQTKITNPAKVFTKKKLNKSFT